MITSGEYKGMKIPLAQYQINESQMIVLYPSKKFSIENTDNYEVLFSGMLGQMDHIMMSQAMNSLRIDEWDFITYPVLDYAILNIKIKEKP